MPHGVFGQRFVGFREPGWHKLGHVFQEVLHDLIEAGKRAGIFDHAIEKCDVLVRYQGRLLKTSEYHAIVRGPTDDSPEPLILGIGSDVFEPIQNLRLAELCNPLAEKWPVETMGVLDQGGRVFFTLDAGSADIAKDEHRMFFLITDAKIPGEGLTIAFTPVRVVCQNTLQIGLGMAKVAINLRHTSGVEERVADVIEIIGDMTHARQRTIEAMRFVAKKTLVDEQIAEIFKAAYPDPKVPGILQVTDGRLGDQKQWIETREKQYQNGIEQMALYRLSAHTLYDKVCDENPLIARTGWAAYNAVVELQDWGSDRKGTDYASIFGGRVHPKELAFKKAFELAGGVS